MSTINCKICKQLEINIIFLHLPNTSNFSELQYETEVSVMISGLDDLQSSPSMGGHSSSLAEFLGPFV